MPNTASPDQHRPLAPAETGQSTESLHGFDPLPHRGEAVSNALIDRLRDEEAV